ncbi:MAG: hypothetical protein WB460_11365 [Candidatus Acidiferrales bacterium]
MKDTGPIPIRLYREFKQDWSDLPRTAQDELAGFLLELQKNPESPEIAARSQRDAAGRLGYEFSPGYIVYWRIVRDESNRSSEFEPLRIEVLAVSKTQIEFSETGQKTAREGDQSAPKGEQDSIERVYSRTVALGNLAMWGTLHMSRRTGRLKGWIVDSWSQGGSPHLSPKMHWVSLPDYKLHHMRLNVDFRSTMQVGPEDTETEAERLIFIRGMLKQWERDRLEEESRKTS